MKKSTKQKVVKVDAIPPQIEKLGEPPLAAEMRGFFQQHGFYRASDIQRVLGDPRESLEVNVMSDFTCSRTVK